MIHSARTRSTPSGMPGVNGAHRSSSLFALVCCICLLPALAVVAQPLRVTYRVEATMGTWQPFLPADLRPAVEHAALEVLSRAGILELLPQAAQSKSDRPTAALLLIHSHILDEAETHTVYLTLDATAQGRLPSLRTSATVVLSGLSYEKMLQRIDASAREAARHLLASLERAIQANGSSSSPTPVAELTPTERELPWQLGTLRIPPATAADRATQQLWQPNPEQRETALRELSSRALIDAAPRHTLERCTIEHPDPALRLRCLIALRPLARYSAPTQRVVIEAFRRGPSAEIRQEASEQMRYFNGVATQEVVQAWLEATAAGRPVESLLQRGDVPNLDVAVARCLVAAGGESSERAGSKRGCIELLEPLPQPRRRAILWRFLRETSPQSPYYLPGAGDREGSIGTIWQWAIEAVLRHAASWPSGLEELLWRRYQRDLSETALRVLADYAPASRQTIERLLEAVQTAGSYHALDGLVRLAKSTPSFSATIRQQLTELLALRTYPKQLGADRLERAIKDLSPSGGATP